MKSSNTVNWDDELTMLMADLFPNVKTSMEEKFNSQQELKNIYDENVDPRQITGYTQIQEEKLKNYTEEDYLHEYKTRTNPLYMHKVNLLLKDEVDSGELMAEHAEAFAYKIKACFRYVETSHEVSMLIVNLARIPMLWQIDLVWNAAADMIIRNNRSDQITLEELSTIAVGFSTARQFNEALFIDVERSVIYKLKEDLKTSPNFGTYYTPALANLMWAFAVAGEGSSEFWYWIDLYLSKNLMNGDFNHMANVVFALYESGWAVNSKSLAAVDKVLSGREMFINNEANDVLIKYEELLKINEIYTMKSNFKKIIPKIGPVI